MNKEKSNPLSIKMSEEEKAIVKQAATDHGETVSRYARRVLLESARSPIYTGKDVMQTLLGISYDMSCLTWENHEEVITQINMKGEHICRLLSSK